MFLQQREIISFDDGNNIIDPFGPTITEPKIDAIVVSSETIFGAFKINKIRIEKNMRPLSILVSDRNDLQFYQVLFWEIQWIIYIINILKLNSVNYL